MICHIVHCEFMHRKAHEEYNMGRLIFNWDRIKSTTACWQPFLTTPLYNRCRALGINDSCATTHSFAQSRLAYVKDCTPMPHVDFTLRRRRGLPKCSDRVSLPCCVVCQRCIYAGNVAAASSRSLPTEPDAMQHMLHIILGYLKRAWYG